MKNSKIELVVTYQSNRISSDEMWEISLMINKINQDTQNLLIQLTQELSEITDGVEIRKTIVDVMDELELDQRDIQIGNLPEFWGCDCVDIRMTLIDETRNHHKLIFGENDEILIVTESYKPLVV